MNSFLVCFMMNFVYLDMYRMGLLKLVNRASVDIY